MTIKVRKIIRVNPAPDIDRATFDRMHKIAHYTALFDRDAQGRVLWDDDRDWPYLESAVERDWRRRQRGETIVWELPEPVAEGSEPPSP